MGNRAPYISQQSDVGAAPAIVDGCAINSSSNTLYLIPPEEEEEETK
jgi:hypothetical protein